MTTTSKPLNKLRKGFPMTAIQFIKWLADIKSAGLAHSDADCARALGVTPHAIIIFKREGVNGRTAVRTALACQALLHRMAPYS